MEGWLAPGVTLKVSLGKLYWRVHVQPICFSMLSTAESRIRVCTKAHFTLTKLHERAARLLWARYQDGLAQEMHKTWACSQSIVKHAPQTIFKTNQNQQTSESCMLCVQWIAPKATQLQLLKFELQAQLGGFLTVAVQISCTRSCFYMQWLCNGPTLKRALFSAILHVSGCTTKSNTMHWIRFLSEPSLHLLSISGISQCKPALAEPSVFLMRLLVDTATCTAQVRLASQRLCSMLCVDGGDAAVVQAIVHGVVALVVSDTVGSCAALRSLAVGIAVRSGCGRCNRQAHIACLHINCYALLPFELASGDARRYVIAQGQEHDGPASTLSDVQTLMKIF